MTFAGLFSDVAVALAVMGLGALIAALYRRRREAVEEEISRLVRPMKHDLDSLQAAEAANPLDREDVAELRRQIRSYGEEAHQFDGRRGMDSLLRQVAETDLARADFYEARTDKIWNFIGYENGRISWRGVGWHKADRLLSPSSIVCPGLGTKPVRRQHQ